MKNLFIDAEWYRNQRIFLFGYAFQISDFGQLYDKSLNRNNIAKILNQVDGYIFCYGPDIGMVEKNIDLKFRKIKRCINLLTVTRYYLPDLTSYKLRHMEYLYDIERKHAEYKDNIFNIWHDWNNPAMKKNILHYNQEDVLNLIRIYKGLKKDFDLTYKDLDQFIMK